MHFKYTEEQDCVVGLFALLYFTKEMKKYLTII